MRMSIEGATDGKDLERSGRNIALGIGVTVVVLLLASAFDMALGLPTFLTAVAVAALTFLRKREIPWKTLGGISWAVLPLVAGLFVLAEGLDRTGVRLALMSELQALIASHPQSAPWIAGAIAAVSTNLVNNLPAGLVAGSALVGAHVDQAVQSAVAIGIDLGANLSVTGSLATILWLTAIRREGEDVNAWQFMRVGALAMPLALLAAFGAMWLQSSTKTDAW